MTGYESKKAMAQDKLEQWDTPSEAFNEWWNGEYDDSTNPFTKHSLAYWAFAGWQAALAQPAQEPVAHCEAGPEYCLQCKLEDRSIVLAAAVRYVKNNTPQLVSDEICMALATPPKRKPLTDEQLADFLGDEYHTMTAEELRYFRLAEAAHGIKENT